MGHVILIQVQLFQQMPEEFYEIVVCVLYQLQCNKLSWFWNKLHLIFTICRRNIIFSHYEEYYWEKNILMSRLILYLHLIILIIWLKNQIRKNLWIKTNIPQFHCSPFLPNIICFINPLRISTYTKCVLIIFTHNSFKISFHFQLHVHIFLTH